MRQPGQGGVWGRMDTCICVAESLRCPPETIRASFISYQSVQLLSRVQLFATPWTAVRQASLSLTNSWSLLDLKKLQIFHGKGHYTAAATAKSLQLCPTLCGPIDGSPPGSPVPGILQARTRVGCHFLLQCMKGKSESEAAQYIPM